MWEQGGGAREAGAEPEEQRLCVCIYMCMLSYRCAYVQCSIHNTNSENLACMY